MKPRDRQKDRKAAYIRPKNTYARFAGKCLCGADISKNAWVRFRGGRVSQCVMCRPEGSMAQDERNRNVGIPTVETKENDND